MMMEYCRMMMKMMKMMKMSHRQKQTQTLPELSYCKAKSYWMMMKKLHQTK